MRRIFGSGLCVLAAFMVIGLATYASADYISGTADYDWQTWVAGNADQDLSPYWDGDSWDSGSAAGIGNYLTNTGYFSGNTAGPGALPFWGSSFDSAADSGGAADPNFYFVKNSSASHAALNLELAGHAAYNEFGWYDIANPSILHPIFEGSVSVNQTTTFTPTENYGFYTRGYSGSTAYIWYTESILNSDQTDDQHFAVFSSAGSENFWIGIEDLPIAGSDNDFNDMVIKVSPVPEPGTLLLLGLGLICLAIVWRKS